MLKNLIVAIVATVSVGTMAVGTAEARELHHRGNVDVYLGFGGFGPGYGYGNGFYDDYGYNRHRYRDRYAYDDYQPYCGTQRIKVKKWNRSHTRYTIVTRRVRDC
jgi:hypothetical protein